jgi:hypothetical protein
VLVGGPTEDGVDVLASVLVQGDLVLRDIALDLTALPLAVGYPDVHPAVVVGYLLEHLDDFVAERVVDPSAGTRAGSRRRGSAGPDRPGPDSQSMSSFRSRARVRPSSRETCIWEMPSRSAIWAWVMLP